MDQPTIASVIQMDEDLSKQQQRQNTSFVQQKTQKEPRRTRENRNDS